MLPERLDPRTDIVFKMLFREEALLIPLLEAVLSPPRPIRRAIVQNPEVPKDYFDEKGSILDILVTLDDGSQVDVEMQCSQEPAFRERALYYWAGVYSGQLAPGGDYRDLAPVISVLFLDYRLFTFPEFHETFRISGAATGEPFSSHLEIHTLELPKVHASNEPLERWCRFLSAEDPLELADLAAHDPSIAMAEERLADISADPANRELARFLHRARANWSIQMAAQLRLGHQEGLAQGRHEGKRQALSGVIELVAQQRFGVLPEETRDRLATATESDLEAMAQRLTTANSLAELIG